MNSYSSAARVAVLIADCRCSDYPGCFTPETEDGFCLHRRDVALMHVPVRSYLVRYCTVVRF